MSIFLRGSTQHCHRYSVGGLPGSGNYDPSQGHGERCREERVGDGVGYGDLAKGIKEPKEVLTQENYVKEGFMVKK